MPRALKKNRAKRFIALVVALIAALGLLLWSRDRQSMDQENSTTEAQGVHIPLQPGKDPSVVRGAINRLPEIEYSKLDKDNELSRLMDSRKQASGIGNSLDMIVKPDESFKVGRTTVHMEDILKKSFPTQNRVFEERIEQSGAVVPETTATYGIHVVQRGDNIWNIHFNILQDYYMTRGKHISIKADEPGDEGYSSGIGKLLKFSESIVTIYNIIEKNVANDINLLEPLSKIVVYNMKEVLSLLQEIDYDNVDQIQFDGKTIWIPAQQPDKEAMN